MTTATLTVTPAEFRVLQAVNFNHFHDGLVGEDKIGNPIWSDCINDSKSPSRIEGKALSGVVSSLVRKGLLRKGNGDCIALTAEGHRRALRDETLGN